MTSLFCITLLNLPVVRFEVIMTIRLCSVMKHVVIIIVTVHILFIDFLHLMLGQSAVVGDIGVVPVQIPTRTARRSITWRVKVNGGQLKWFIAHHTATLQVVQAMAECPR